MATAELPRLFTTYGWGTVIREYGDGYLMEFDGKIMEIFYYEILMPKTKIDDQESSI